MKKIKKISAVAMAMALTAATMVPTFALDKATTFTGQINASDLSIDLTLPSTGTLTMKPYASDQISSSNGIAFVNTSADTAYTVGIAGYTCVATPKTTGDTFTIAATKPASGTNKVATVKIELAQPTNATATAVTTDAATFKTNFTASTPVAVQVSKATTNTYDGKTSTDYTKATADTINIATGEAASLRITGEMNEKANWVAGDKLVVVPVFSVSVSMAAAN